MLPTRRSPQSSNLLDVNQMPVRRKVKPGAGRPRVYATDLPVYDTMDQCSGATGIPKSMLQLASKEGCLFVRHGRVHLAEFLRWFFGPRPQNSDGEENIDWDKRGKRAQALIREADLEEKRGTVVDFSLAKDFIEHVTRALFFGELERMEQEFPASLKGKNEVDIQVEMKRQGDMVRKNLELALKTWIDTKGKKKK